MTKRLFVTALVSIVIILFASSVDVRADDLVKSKEGKKPAAEKVKEKETDENREEKACEKERNDEEEDAEEASEKTVEGAENESEPAETEAKEKEESEAEKEGEEEKEESAEGAEKKPATVAVKKEPFSIEVALEGVFAAKGRTEISLAPKAWSNFIVLKAVEHGAGVKKGDLLIACDTEEIDKALDAAQRDFEIADLAFKQRTAEFELLNKLTPMELAELKRSYKWAKEDAAYYWETLLPMEKESIELSYEYAKFNLEYTKEELRQLEKMYEADDLIEETEEIILKRARAAVKQAEFVFKRAEARYEREKEISLPRELQQRKESERRRDMAYSVAEKVFPMLVKQRELEMAKAKVAHEEAKEKLDELRADRKLMSLKAPRAGTVYYGESVRGKWASASSLAAKLKPNGKLTPKEILLTILEDGPFLAEADFTEKEVRDVREGVKATVTPTAYPEMKLDAIVNRVLPLPSTGTSFHAELNVARHADDDRLLPGMTCSLKLAAYEKEDALTLPPKAVKTDPKSDKQFVYVVEEGEEPSRREIKTGRKTEKAVEILAGLEEGDEVLAAPPDGDAENKGAEKKRAENGKDAPNDGNDSVKRSDSEKS